MNENIDLTKILKDCPKGTKLYSTIFGEVKFVRISGENSHPVILKAEDESVINVDSEGKHFSMYEGECTLFPSREQRDWNKFTAPWYKKEKASLQTNERAWLYLVVDVLTWKDGIGQYLDDPRVQELAKRLRREYAQKLYNLSVIEDKKPKNKVHFYVARDKNGAIYLYLGKPERRRYCFLNSYGICSNSIANKYYFEDFGLSSDDFNNLKWEDEPVEVFLNMED